jgi:hypothetical protein
MLPERIDEPPLKYALCRIANQRIATKPRLGKKQMPSMR